MPLVPWSINRKLGWRWNIFRRLTHVKRHEESTRQGYEREDMWPVNVEHAVSPVTVDEYIHMLLKTGIIDQKQISTIRESSEVIDVHKDCVHKRRLIELRVEVQRLTILTRVVNNQLGSIVTELCEQETKYLSYPINESKDIKYEPFIVHLQDSRARLHKSEAWLDESQSRV